MDATYHLETSSEIFTVLRNIIPPEGTNMYSISAGYARKSVSTMGIYNFLVIIFLISPIMYNDPLINIKSSSLASFNANEIASS